MKKEIKEVQILFIKAIEEKKVNLYKKVQKVDAKLAKGGERIATVIDGQQETINTAKEGDYIIRSRSGSHELYIISGDKFLKRYVKNKNSVEDDGGFSEYDPIGEAYAFEYHGENFSFVAPWGEEMIVNDGDYICALNLNNLSDIYRIEKKAFKETYK